MSVEASTQRHAPQVLREIVTRILCACAVAESDAAMVAESLVLAELRGQSSHGLVRLETYVKRVRAGLIRRRSEPSVVWDSPSLRIYDAANAFGHVVGRQVMDDCISRARTIGMAGGAVRNSTHFGIAGAFALRAADAGMIGLAASNGAARMPPFGTRTPVLGTNPLAVAFPRGTAKPVVLDMATSATALGKILVARDRGETIPEGWALTKDGLPTRDATAAIAGLMLPMAGPKGFGLAFVLEVLSACLSAAAVGQQAGSMYNTWDAPERIGHFFLAIAVPDPLRTEFLARVDELARQVHAAEPIGSASPLLPGELESRIEEQNSRDGIPVSDGLRDVLRRLASDAAVTIEL